MKFIKEKLKAATLGFDQMIKGGSADMAARLVPFLYYFMFFIAFSKLEGLNHLIAHPQKLYPRFPIFWAEGVSYAAVVSIVFVTFVFTSLIGSFFYKNFTARLLAFLGILQFHAYNSSFGVPNHQWDIWLWVTFIFIFFPNVWKETLSNERRKKFLIVFWVAQAFVLMTYTMSGIGKLLGSYDAIRAGQAHAFSQDAAALHISSLLLSMQETTIFGPAIVKNPILGWFPFIAVIYLQFFSFFIAFKPKLHRLWSLGLVLFHIGTYLSMRAIFVSPVAILMILFFSSPFQNQKNPWQQIFLDLPIFGGTIKMLQTKIKKL